MRIHSSLSPARVCCLLPPATRVDQPLYPSFTSREQAKERKCEYIHSTYIFNLFV